MSPATLAPQIPQSRLTFSRSSSRIISRSRTGLTSPSTGSLTSEVEEGITGLDVGQEGIPKTLTLSSTLHQASDVTVDDSGNTAHKQNYLAGLWKSTR
ncbi:hypothetical protein E2C01_036518 [Portunus trituberculatus]|uniref:Uncharacterized protein n=1 Tax=Portunus trituberculatus TaxID=210409 RepID=A0A5B7FBD8_PORTR|nr:hypothetical protein [Portunus trituberculatus]